MSAPRASVSETIRQELRPGETLLWTGAPDPGKHLNHRDAYAVPITAGFAVAMVGTGLRSALDEGGIGYWIMALLALSAAAFALIGRFWVKVRQKRRIGYAITDQRVIFAKPGLVEDLRVADEQPLLRYSGDGRHVDATFRDGWQVRQWENTGFNTLFPDHNSIGFVFYDVPDPEGLVSALARAHGEELDDDAADMSAVDTEGREGTEVGADDGAGRGAGTARDTPADDHFAQQLRVGEDLLWTGSPDPTRHFDHRDAWLIPLGIVLGAASVWSSISFAAAGSPMAALIGIPGLLIGILLMGGRLFLKSRTKAATRYAVTSQRALIFRPAGALETRTLAGSPIAVRISKDGRHGTIRFGTATPWQGLLDNTGLELSQQIPPAFVFHDVADHEAARAALVQAGASGLSA